MTSSEYSIPPRFSSLQFSFTLSESAQSYLAFSCLSSLHPPALPAYSEPAVHLVVSPISRRGAVEMGVERLTSCSPKRMNFPIHSPAVPSENVTTGTMLCELETALDRNYQKIRESARTR